ncbi:hypothetical protein BLNAU_10158 [Blattamonas nauphoetae]|uniref:Uncharacterized protein n=1 Tax=Blattamonas nauphoetae TaxID=2049346 RepID=A0ABQ9XTL9_9EUKA|nr:hypothetical protein BLNAU_10158 [Blattamonas nauphoetae]
MLCHEISDAALRFISTTALKATPANLLHLLEVDLIHHIFKTINPLTVPIRQRLNVHLEMFDLLVSILSLIAPPGRYQPQNVCTAADRRKHQIVITKAVTTLRPYFDRVCQNWHAFENNCGTESALDFLTNLLVYSAYYPALLTIVQELPIASAISCLLASTPHPYHLICFMQWYAEFHIKWQVHSPEVTFRGKVAFGSLSDEGIENLTELIADPARYFIMWNPINKAFHNILSGFTPFNVETLEPKERA